jgi:hypothetical protein
MLGLTIIPLVDFQLLCDEANVRVGFPKVMIQLAISVDPGKALAITMCFGIFKLSKLCKLEKHS